MPEQQLIGLQIAPEPRRFMRSGSGYPPLLILSHSLFACLRQRGHQALHADTVCVEQNRRNLQPGPQKGHCRRSGCAANELD